MSRPMRNLVYDKAEFYLIIDKIFRSEEAA